MQGSPAITIPEPSEEGPVSIGSNFQKDTKARFEKIDQILFAIIASAVISSVGVVVAVVGLFIDQLRYNNAAYRDYAQKVQATDTVLKLNEDLRKTNNELHDMNNMQQLQIQELLNQKP